MDNAVYNRPIRLRRQEKNHISNTKGPALVRHDLHEFRLAQGGIHAGTLIGGEERLLMRACDSSKLAT
ncbi:MAG TPA: hypothetical protein VEI28_04880 [Thermodesulfovibrionales bacterium]|nr:hypothetical protein [Thermodesulfovibrionales bacterium]